MRWLQNSVFNISQALDQEALAIYEQAQAEAQRRSKGKPDDTPSTKTVQRRFSRSTHPGAG